MKKTLTLNKENKHYLLALFLLSQRKYYEALEQLNIALSIKQNDEFYFMRAIAYDGLEKQENVILDCTNTININKNNSKAYILRSQAKEELGFYEEALQDLEKASFIDRNSKDIYLLKASLYRKLLKPDLAVVCCDLAIDIDEECGEAYFIRAEIKRDFRMYYEAIEDFQEALNLSYSPAETYFEIGKTYETLCDFKYALENYNLAININPKYADAYSSRAHVLLKEKRYPEALKDYNYSVELDPKNETFYINRGIYFVRRNYYESAIKDFSKAIELNNTFFLAYSNLGTLYLEIEKFEEAIKILNKAVELEPNFAPAFYSRALAKGGMKNREGKLLDLKKTINLQLKNCHMQIKDDFYVYLFRPINNNTLSSLKDNYLWFSHPSEFNDPLDSKYYENSNKNKDKELSEILENIRIRSFTSGNYDIEKNILLWSHYADKHRGIVIEYELNVKKLQDIDINICPISYNDYLEQNNNELDLTDYGVSYYTKAECWEYENEYRMVTLKENLIDENKLFKGFKIKSIIFGLKSNKEDRNLIKKTLPNCDFYQMVFEDKIHKPFSIIKRKLK